MSVSSSGKPTSKAVTVLPMTAMSMVVVSLQIGLPWLSYSWTTSSADRSIDRRHVYHRWQAESTITDFWYCRAVPLLRENLRCRSATICGDELIALLSRSSPDPAKLSIRSGQPFIDERENSVPPLEPTEMIRCNLKCGWITTSPVPSGVRHVLSDGTRMWWLPRHPGVEAPFMWNGRPTALVSSPKDAQLCQFMEFVNDRWQLTDRFGLMPDSFDMERRPLFKVQTSDTHIVVVITPPGDAFYKTLEIVSEDDARKYLAAHPRFINQMQAGDFEEMGWKLLSGRGDVAAGFWLVDDIPFTTASVGMLPIAGQENNGNRTTVQCVTSSDGQVYLLEFGSRDGRLHVLNVTDRTPHLVARRGGSWSSWTDFGCRVCPGAVSFLCLAFVIPMGVLTAWTWGWKRRRGPEEIVVGDKNAITATIVRRAVARFVDLSLLLSLLALSVLCHPDFLQWWSYLTGFDSLLVQSLGRLLATRDLNFLNIIHSNARSWVHHFLTVQFVAWPLIAAALLIIAQVAWQGRAGQTLGKWLLGIKVARTTLRPCGLARSLLRELFVVLDSLVLLSWLPGAISILVSSQSQRIGDRLADTIVIRK